MEITAKTDRALAQLKAAAGLQRRQHGLRRALVQRHLFLLEARAPIGVLFSGGADSGAVLLCAYRALSNTPEMRRALLRAEAMSGTKMDPRAIAAGEHSHDGGATWSKH